MIIVFHGEDGFRMRLELRERISDIAKKEPARIKIFGIADEKGLEEVFAFLSAAELWQEKKVAVAKFAEWSSDLAKTLKNEAKNKNDFGTNILFVLVPKNRVRVSEIPEAEYKEFSGLTGRILIHWIQETAVKFGNTIDANASRVLIELRGQNTEGIWNELLLLSCWKPNGKISGRDIAMFRRELPHPKDFALIEALLEGNRKKALKLLHHEFSEHKAPLMILGSMVTHFRALLVAKFSGKSGEVSVQKFFAQNHPFWVSKIESASQHFSAEEIRQTLQKLWRIDRAAKTGEYEPEMLLEEFIIGA